VGQKTALFEEHQRLGAKIVDFAGWEMPVYYSTPLKEHLAVRGKAGLFDVSHMGEIFVTGKEALKLIQLLVTRDCSKLRDGGMALGVMCNEAGGIIDDLIVYRFSEEKYLIVVNAGTMQNDLNWIEKHAAGMDCAIENKSGKTAKLDLQGPNAEKILQKLTEFKLSGIERYNFVEASIAGIESIVSRSGYTGEDGFELYFAEEKAVELWNALLEAGKKFELQPCGLASRDTLRLECCMALYGHELSEKKSPLQSGYGWAVDFEKEEFIGKKALEKQKADGFGGKLIAFEMVERAIARDGCKIFVEGKESGIVTSGSFSPSLKKNIGLGYIGAEFSEPGQGIEVEVRGNKFKAKVVKRPFYRRE